MNDYNISIVMGSKNRKNLLKATIESIQNNGFKGSMEIIVVDGGSTDGTCDWLAKQKDIFTIIQPNYKTIDKDGVSVLAHSWGNFMNLGFKLAKAPWIVMVSDDLILEKGALQNGYEELAYRISLGDKIGGGAFYFREYPRDSCYRVGILPKDYILINHGFFRKEALQDVNYINEIEYNFYYADGDLSMRLNDKGWITIALTNSYADHLVHMPIIRRKRISNSTLRDQSVFKDKHPENQSLDKLTSYYVASSKLFIFWRFAFANCFLGVLLKVYDKYYHLIQRK